VPTCPQRPSLARNAVLTSRTGWSDEARVGGLDLPDEQFDYDDFVKREFGGGKSPVPRGISWWWWVVAIVLANRLHPFLVLVPPTKAGDEVSECFLESYELLEISEFSSKLVVSPYEAYEDMHPCFPFLDLKKTRGSLHLRPGRSAAAMPSRPPWQRPPEPRV